MFFITKFLWIVLQPISLTFVLMVLSLIASILGWSRTRTGLMVASSLIFSVMLFTSTGSWGLAKLEDRYPKPATDPVGATCIIVLGGAVEAEIIHRRGGFELNQAADRFVEALRLARILPQVRILISGGDGSLSGKYEGDAAVSERFFTSFGIALTQLVKETGSRTTTENVAMTKMVLEKEGMKNCLLVTSAFHMPRAVNLFQKQGIKVIPWPVDFRTAGSVGLRFDFTQPALNVQLTSTAAREWMATVGAYVTGDTMTLMPQ